MSYRGVKGRMTVSTYGLKNPVRIDVAICIWTAYILIVIFMLQVVVISGLTIRWYHCGGKVDNAIEKRLSVLESGVNSPTRASSTFEMTNTMSKAPSDLSISNG